MTRPVVFDTWAWVEVLRNSDAGRMIQDRYLANPKQIILTTNISLAEAALTLHVAGRSTGEIMDAVNDIVTESDHVVCPDVDDAVVAAPLRTELRRVKRDASLADAFILAVARNRGFDLVSCDEAYDGQPDVVCPRTR